MKKAKSFDAVKFMREARDRMSRDMPGMSVQEQIAYVRKHAAWSNEVPRRSRGVTPRSRRRRPVARTRSRSPATSAV
jgi:hypothetical protein